MLSTKEFIAVMHDLDVCLGVPAKVVKLLEDHRATVDFGGIKREVSTDLLPEVRVGEYVIVHAGFAISKISEKEAHEIITSWREVLDILREE